ncbi:MAG TPA: hypothetical protein VN841_03000 [Bryobacteraceae bacterium]|nr:hypothetical protein [Bryobacteraceae bacterium]
MAMKVKVPTSHGKTPIGAYYSPGIFTDAGGVIIYVGKDGKLHVKRVPPWDPNLSQLNLAASLIAQAENVTDVRIANQMRDLANTILSSQSNQMIGVLNQLQE